MENELRIGNYIYDNGRQPLPVIVIVSGIDETGQIWTADAEYDRGHRRVIDSAPIPLTPELADLFGFVKDRNGWNLPDTKFSLTDNLFPCWLDRMLWPGGLPDFNNAQLQYVHQLQNLYFALTSKELTINHEHLQTTS